jgi:predicted transcriptional regulator
MTISKIRELLDATVYCGEQNLSREVYMACGSDMMSDVLAYVKDQAVLLTGLVNTQVIRTAEMMDMICVVFVRNKQPSAEMIALAKEHGIVLMSTSKRMYESCGILYSEGLNRNSCTPTGDEHPVDKQPQNGTGENHA